MDVLRSQSKVLAEYSTLTASPNFTYIYAGDQRIAMRNAQHQLHFYLDDQLKIIHVAYHHSASRLRLAGCCQCLYG